MQTNGHHNEISPFKKILVDLDGLGEKPRKEVVEDKADQLMDDIVLNGFKSNEIYLIGRKLKRLGLSQRWVTGWMRRVKAHEKETRDESPPTDDDSDGPLYPTWPYENRDGQIVFLSQRFANGSAFVTAQPVADFTVRVVKRIIQGDNLLLQLAGQGKRGGSFGLELLFDDFSEDRRLKVALEREVGLLDPVYAGMAKHLNPAIKKLMLEEPPQTQRYLRVGWEGKFRIPGLYEGDEFQLLRKLVYDVGTGELEKGQEAFTWLLDSNIETQAILMGLTFVLQAPLGGIMDWRDKRYALVFTGNTGARKTELSKLLMCVYGPKFFYKSNLIKWGEGATSGSLMGYAVYVADFPLLFDNFKPNTGSGTKGFLGLIHNIIEGSEKDRLIQNNKTGHYDPNNAREVYAWPLFTGESVPDVDAASAARLLIVQLERLENQFDKNLGRAQELSAHLCAIGRSWLEWLDNEASSFIEQAKSFQTDSISYWAKVLNEYNPHMINVMRVATSLATNSLTWWLMLQHPVLGKMLAGYDGQYKKGLRGVACRMAEATNESFEASRFLNGLRELLVMKKAILIKRLDKIPMFEEARSIGWYDEDGTVYLSPKIARIQFKKNLDDELNEIANNTLYKQLRSLDALILSPDGKSTRAIQVEKRGKKMRLLWIKPGILPIPQNKDSPPRMSEPSEKEQEIIIQEEIPF
jgi:hypothetical protein